MSDTEVERALAGFARAVFEANFHNAMELAS